MESASKEVFMTAFREAAELHGQASSSKKEMYLLCLATGANNYSEESFRKTAPEVAKFPNQCLILLAEVAHETLQKLYQTWGFRPTKEEHEYLVSLFLQMVPIFRTLCPNEQKSDEKGGLLPGKKKIEPGW